MQPTPILWLTPDSAKALLTQRMGDTGSADFLIVKIDPDAAPIGSVVRGGPRFRPARFALDEGGDDFWIDAMSGLRIFTIEGWALGQ